MFPIPSKLSAPAESPMALALTPIYAYENSFFRVYPIEDSSPFSSPALGAMRSYIRVALSTESLISEVPPSF